MSVGYERLKDSMLKSGSEVARLNWSNPAQLPHRSQLKRHEKSSRSAIECARESYIRRDTRGFHGTVAAVRDGWFATLANKRFLTRMRIALASIGSTFTLS